MDDELLLASLLGRAPGGPPIRPLTALSIQIAPEVSAGHSEADYAVALRNGGPAPLTLQLSADDRRRLLSYELGAERLTLAPGQTAHVPLTVEAPRRLAGPDQPVAFTVYAEPEGAPAVSAEARFVRRAALPGRAALLLAALLLVALLAPPLAGRLAGRTAEPTPPQPAAIPTPAPGAPLIAALTASPAAVAPGQPVTIYWDVRGAERVTLEPFGPVPPLGQRELRPAQSEELRLVATAAGKETVAVLRVVVEP